MREGTKIFLLACCMALALWPLYSLVAARPACEIYGGGSPSDSCEDECWGLLKGVAECAHDGEFDDCETDRCLLTTSRAAECPEKDPPACTNDCPYQWVANEWRVAQVEREIDECDSDDWSGGWKPAVSWGKCQYGINGVGRCFSSVGCYGDEVTWRYLWGRYKCSS